MATQSQQSLAHKSGTVSLRFKGSDATLVQSRVLFDNLTAPIVTSARANRHQTWTKTSSESTTHHGEISLDRLVCRRCTGAQALKRRPVKIYRSQPTCRQHQRPGCKPEYHRNALNRKTLQKTPMLAMAQAQTCHRPASAPKLRLNP
jgi:hypothetical protein